MSHDWQETQVGSKVLHHCEQCSASMLLPDNPQGIDLVAAMNKAAIPKDCPAAPKGPLSSEDRIERLEQAVRDLYQLDCRFKNASFSKEPDSFLVALQAILAEGDKE